MDAVERVARAICIASEYNRAVIDGWQEWIPEAQAALSAIHYVEMQTVVEAAHNATVGGNHLVCLLPRDFPKAGTSPGVALARIGAGPSYDVWCCWNALMSLAETLRRLDVAMEAEQEPSALDKAASSAGRGDGPT